MKNAPGSGLLSIVPLHKCCGSILVLFDFNQGFYVDPVSPVGPIAKPVIMRAIIADLKSGQVCRYIDQPIQVGHAAAPSLPEQLVPQLDVAHHVLNAGTVPVDHRAPGSWVFNGFDQINTTSPVFTEQGVSTKQ